MICSYVERNYQFKSRENHLETCNEVASNLYKSFCSDKILVFDLHPELVGEDEEANIDEQPGDSCSVENSTNKGVLNSRVTLDRANRQGDEEEVSAEDGEDDAGDHPRPGQDGGQPGHSEMEKIILGQPHPSWCVQLSESVVLLSHPCIDCGRDTGSPDNTVAHSLILIRYPLYMLSLSTAYLHFLNTCFLSTINK